MPRQGHARESGEGRAWAPSGRGDFAAVKKAHGKRFLSDMILTGYPRSDRRAVASGGSSFGTGAVDRTGQSKSW